MASLTVTYAQFKTITDLLAGLTTVYMLNPSDPTKVEAASLISTATTGAFFAWSTAAEQPTETVFLLDFPLAKRVESISA